MPIVDYRRIADQGEKSFFNDRNISQKNKELMRGFLDAYDVSPARLGIFFRHISFLLRETPEINKDMLDRGKINRIFRQFRERLSRSYYATVVNVSIMFVTRLNDGEKPPGFKDIKNVSNKALKRQLTPEDMISWEEGEKCINATNSIQLKALLATQLDGGFRPSEFVDLNYGDISVKSPFIVCYVRQGKTGPRPVILWRAVPDLLRWVSNHPTKRKDDPLWTQEHYTKGQIIRYKYHAVQKRVNEMFLTVKINKPTDFYNLRHSACVLAKLDNIPEEEAAKKFGHSVKFYTETYGRLTAEDSLKRFGKAYGLQEQEKEVSKPISCQRCAFVNVPKAVLCEQCSSPLSIEKAMALEKEKTKDLTELKERLHLIEEHSSKTDLVMERVLDKNPEFRRMLKNSIREMIQAKEI